MANMQMRNKLRKITEAAKNSEHIPAHSKKIGMMIFFVLAGAGILSMMAFTIALYIHGYRAGAILALVITLVIAYFFYKVYSADEMPID